MMSPTVASFGALGRRFKLFEQRRGQRQNATSDWLRRVSRIFTVILKKPNKRTKPADGKLLKAIKDLPHIARTIHHS